jgi:hypothetical protein
LKRTGDAPLLSSRILPQAHKKERYILSLIGKISLKNSFLREELHQIPRNPCNFNEYYVLSVDFTANILTVRNTLRGYET